MSEGVAGFVGLVDLASSAVGGAALLASDAFFADASNLVNPKPARFDPTTYTDRGKEMDGWESRRRRTPGHDWCILRLGVPGRVRAVDIDTAHFLGNHAPFASVDATVAPADATAAWLRDHATWTRIVPETAMQRGSHNLCAATGEQAWTHVRLNIYPDGGVARLRVMGEPAPEIPSGRADLASVLSGGRAVVCSDAFFSPMDQLVQPGHSAYMGGGWETRRSRPPGEDWIAVRLGAPARLDRIEIDTDHFKGNYPDRVQIEGLYWPGATGTALRDSPDWAVLVPSAKLAADARFGWDLADAPPVTHLRVRIFPDGGLSRLRAFGVATADTPADVDRGLSLVNAASDEALARCCGARRWVAAMAAARPFTSRAHLFGVAASAWWHLDQADWTEAFAHHPRIGADVAALRAKFAATADWSAGEQAGVTGASEDTLAAIASGNAAYEARFGYLFIVCATGLSAAEMLARLTERMGNAPEAELRIAAGEQARITRIRLEKLLEEG